MKSLQKSRWILVLFLTFLAIVACSKDEVVNQVVPNTAVETDKTKDTTSDGNNTNGNTTDGNTTNGNTTDGNNTNGNTTDGNTPKTAGKEGEITLYKVDGGNLVKEKDFAVTGNSVDFQKDTAKHQEIWELVKKIITADYMAKLNQFIIYSKAEEGNGTDGFVIQTSDDQSTWKLGIAIDHAYEDGFNVDGNLAYTIIHEFGHILTLDNTQVDPTIPEGSCQNFFPGEGCAKKDSYINKLYTKFWADIWGEFSSLKGTNDQQAFYDKYKDRFVSQYASSNPGEDIAESFATFVTDNGMNETGVAKEKIQLMYDQPQLVEIRNLIRGNMTFAKGSSYLPVAGSWKRANTFANPKKGCTHRSR